MAGLKGISDCNRHASKSKFPYAVTKISFQSLVKANEDLKNHFGIHLDQVLTTDEWGIANISFQIRHLIAHKMGIIDENYVTKTGDSSWIVGRKIIISHNDVLNLIPIIQKMAEFLTESISD